MDDDLFFEDDPLGQVDAGSVDESRQVTTVAGHRMPVLDESEKEFYEQLRDGYTASYQFTDPGDVSDLDRILTLELTTFRLNKQLGQGHDHHGLPLGTKDIASINRTLKDIALTLSKAKDNLGLSKLAREAGAEEDPATYLQDLRRRALEMGVHRNKQVTLAIAELMELISIAQTYLRSNDFERSNTDYRTAEDIVRHIAVEVAQKMEELDAHFREHGQKIWVGKV